MSPNNLSGGQYVMEPNTNREGNGREERSVGERLEGRREIMCKVVETVIRVGRLKISMRGRLKGCWDRRRGGGKGW